MFHKKFGPDRFSRFDVYWIQTNKQTNKQTYKPNLYLDTIVKGHSMFQIGGSFEIVTSIPFILTKLCC